jgi:hypothetical protein
MLGAVNAWHERVQEELIATEIEISPGALAVIVLGAFEAALRASARAAPFKANIDPLALTIELGLGNVPGILNSKEFLEKFGVAHGEELRRRQKYLSPAHPNFRRPNIFERCPSVRSRK